MRLLSHYGINRIGISRQLSLSPIVVYKVMDPARCGGVLHGNVLIVRARVEAMLTAAGWRGKPAELWTEYDDSTRKAA